MSAEKLYHVSIIYGYMYCERINRERQRKARLLLTMMPTLLDAYLYAHVRSRTLCSAYHASSVCGKQVV